MAKKSSKRSPAAAAPKAAAAVAEPVIADKAEAAPAPAVVEVAEITEATAEVAEAAEAEQTADDEAKYSSITLTIRLPNQRTVQHTTVLTENVAAVHQTILENPRMVHYSSSHLALAGKRLAGHEVVGSLAFPEGAAEKVLDLVEQPYGERDVRVHVQRLHNILYSHSTRAQSDAPAIDTGVSAFKFVTGERYLANPAFDADAAELYAKDKRHFETVYDNEDSAHHEFGEFVAANAAKNRKVVKALTGLAVSGWNPVPAWRRLRGDLLYLAATFTNGETVHITASRDGFFANNSTDAAFDPARRSAPVHSLAKLLANLNGNFSKTFTKTLDRLAEARESLFAPVEDTEIATCIPAINWNVSVGDAATDHVFDPLRGIGSIGGGSTVLEASALDAMRDMNDDLQINYTMAVADADDPTYGELPPLVRVRQYTMLQNQFVKLATAGARGILDGSIPSITSSPEDPTNLKEQMFIWNGIFFSHADAEAARVRLARDNHADSAAAARTIVGKDVTAIRLLQNLGIRGLHTMQTAVIDLHGHRIVAQCLVPGIMGDGISAAQIVYGAQDDQTAPEDSMEPSQIKADPEFHALLAQAAEKLHWKEHEVTCEVTGEKVPLWSSADHKGLVGHDGRKYLFEAWRSTPLDTAFLDDVAADKVGPAYPHVYTLVRPELINLLQESVTQDHITAGLAEFKARREAEGAAGEDVEIPSADLEAIVGSVPKLRFNTDLGTAWAKKEDADPADVEAHQTLSNYLYQTAIPNFVMSIARIAAIPTTSASLTSTLHEQGVSMRHLAYIIKAIDMAIANADAEHSVALAKAAEIAQKHIAKQEAKLAKAQAKAAKAQAKAAKGEAEEEIIKPEGAKESDDEDDKEDDKEDEDEEKVPSTSGPAQVRLRLTALKAIVEREILLRVFKHTARAYLAKSTDLPSATAALLTAFVNLEELPAAPETKPVIDAANPAELTSAALAAAIAYEAAARFRYTFPAGATTATAKKVLLREAALKLGAQLVARTYGPSFRVEERDVVQLAPKVKTSFFRSQLVSSHLEYAQTTMQGDTVQAVHNAFEQALMMYEQAYSLAHPETLQVMSTTAEICHTMYRKSKNEETLYLERALELQRQVVLGSERVFGLDAAETATAYQSLAHFEAAAGRIRLALKYLRHAEFLTELQTGTADLHPEWVATANMTSRLHEAIGRFDHAIAAQLKLHEYYKTHLGANESATASAAYQLGNQYCSIGDFDRALPYLGEASRTWFEKFGPKDGRAINASQFFQAVQIHRANLAFEAQNAEKLRQSGELKRKQEAEERKTIGTKGDMPIEDILAYIDGKPSKGGKGKKRKNQGVAAAESAAAKATSSSSRKGKKN
ncbi:Intracellular distribution of mitochondria [Blastocladiella emersonii ATCC 22665]|nr:Intracellular distribution of mitochondria [Blastocladiella emersonii ATCC 22665]